MYYIVETSKSFEQAANDLDAAVKSHGFGALHIHNLGMTLPKIIRSLKCAIRCRRLKFWLSKCV